MDLSVNQRLGYACINNTLAETKDIRINRGMIKKTFNEKGIDYASELALLNVKDLIRVIEWNENIGIHFYRMSSSMFPWSSHYDLKDLKDYDEIVNCLITVKEIADRSYQRLTFHPGPYNILASDKKYVVRNAIKDLNQHSEIFDIMGYEPSHWNKINIHIGATYGDKPSAIDRFCENFLLLDESTKKRLVVENDDKPTMFSVKDLYEVYERIGTPITFDVHHHKYCHSGLTHKEAALMAASTWKDAPPCFHFSSTINHEQPDKIARAHADYIYEEINDYGTGAWIMVEAKSKEESILYYINEGVMPSEYDEPLYDILVS